MAKNSGSTRAGGNAGGSAQGGQSMNDYHDFARNSNLNALLDRAQSLATQLQNMEGDSNASQERINSVYEEGRKAIDAYRTAAEAAARGLRSGVGQAEDRIEENVEEIRKQLSNYHGQASNALATRMRSIAEKIVNNKESDEERAISRNNGYTYNYSNGVVDIYRNGRRVAKGIRKNGKYDIKWF